MELIQRDADTFALELDGKRFEHWSEIELRQSLDCFSSVGFLAPFDPSRREFRDLFRPFGFTPAKLYLGDELVFTGRIANVEPSMAPDGVTVRVQCTALPAVLETCTAVPEAVVVDGKASRLAIGREFCGLDLLNIAKSLCLPFGFDALVAEAIAGAFTAEVARTKTKEALAIRYPKVRLEPDKVVHEFLCTLAKQRGVLLSDDALGNVVFRRPVATGNSVVTLEEGKAPLVSVTPHFSPDDYCSEVTCCVPKKRGKKGGRHTLRNPFARAGLILPRAFTAEDTKVGDGPGAAQAWFGRMFGNMASWDVELPTFRDPQGRRFRANTTLNLKAPSAMIYGRHELLVRDVTLRQDATTKTCELGLVLPGAFGDEMPTVLPWNEAL